MGTVKDLYFDDQHWTIRDLVADTGNWLTGRQVLLPPYALVAAIKADPHIMVDETMDDESWTIRYRIVETRNWWPGKKVVVSARWMVEILWNERKVFVNLPREQIKQSPEYTEDSLITRDYETEMHQHYHSERYWAEGEIGPAKKGHDL